MPCVAVARNSLAINHGELGILQEPFPPWPQTVDGIARNDFFSSRGILKVSLVQRVFPVFPLPFCVLFFCFSFPDFEIISSCCKFGSYFRGRFKRRIVVPLFKLWFWRVGGGVGTDKGGHYATRRGFILSGFPYRFQSKWFVAYGAPSFEP